MCIIWFVLSELQEQVKLFLHYRILFNTVDIWFIGVFVLFYSSWILIPYIHMVVRTDALTIS